MPSSRTKPYHLYLVSLKLPARRAGAPTTGAAVGSAQAAGRRPACAATARPGGRRTPRARPAGPGTERAGLPARRLRRPPAVSLSVADWARPPARERTGPRGPWEPRGTVAPRPSVRAERGRE